MGSNRCQKPTQSPLDHTIPHLGLKKEWGLVIFVFKKHTLSAITRLNWQGSLSSFGKSQ
jgi:hypothetical protein